MDVPEEQDLEEFEEIGTSKQAPSTELLNWQPIDELAHSFTEDDDFTKTLIAKLEEFKAKEATQE